MKKIFSLLSLVILLIFACCCQNESSTRLVGSDDSAYLVSEGLKPRFFTVSDIQNFNLLNDNDRISVYFIPQGYPGQQERYYFLIKQHKPNERKVLIEDYLLYSRNNIDSRGLGLYEFIAKKGQVLIKDTIEKEFRSITGESFSVSNHKTLEFHVKLLLITKFQLTNIEFLPHIGTQYFLNLRNVKVIRTIDELTYFEGLLNDTAICKKIPLPRLTDCLSIRGEGLSQYYMKYNYNLYLENNEFIKKSLVRVYFDRSLYFNAVDSLNKAFLIKQLPTIKEEIPNNNVLFFYSLPDLKLFKVKFLFDQNGEVRIFYKYINPQYCWNVVRF